MCSAAVPAAAGRELAVNAWSGMLHRITWSTLGASLLSAVAVSEAPGCLVLCSCSFVQSYDVPLPSAYPETVTAKNSPLMEANVNM